MRQRMMGRWGWCIVVLLVGGCASATKSYTWSDVHQVVTPVPYVPHGYLKVFTKTIAMSTSEDSYYPHSPYTIYSEDGKKVRYVENHSSREDKEPTTVELSPGKYVIAQEGGSRKEDIVGAVIEDQKLTEVRFRDSGLDQATREELQRQ